MRLDEVGGGDGRARVDDRDGATDLDSRELPVVHKATGVAQPRLGKQVETFEQAVFGMGTKFGGALSRVGASATSLPSSRRCRRSPERRAIPHSCTSRTMAAK